MSFEALWYSSYSPAGAAPKCKRYCRLPMSTQWDLTIDLAVSLAKGYAGYRPVHISMTGEEYWYWPHPLSKTGWWLLPRRIVGRANRLIHDAQTEAFRGHVTISQEDVARVLRSWQRTGAWRRHVWDIVPRCPDEPPARRRGMRGVQ